MKEYKVIKPKLGIRNRLEKLQEILNQNAREGWIVNHVAQSAYFVILERDKNR